MEERPRQSEDDSENNTKAYGDKVNPGEIFLKKWLGFSEKDPAAEKTTNRQQEESHFTESFKDTVFPKVVSRETARSDTQNDETFYERAEEIQFERKHEIKNSKSRDKSFSSQEAAAPKPAEANEEPSDMHHISSVIGERAKDIKNAKQPGKENTRQKTQTKGTLSYFLRPVSIGFLSAIIVLMLILAINLLV